MLKSRATNPTLWIKKERRKIGKGEEGEGKTNKSKRREKKRSLCQVNFKANHSFDERKNKFSFFRQKIFLDKFPQDVPNFQAHLFPLNAKKQQRKNKLIRVKEKKRRPVCLHVQRGLRIP
jgi:hypothetical protein